MKMAEYSDIKEKEDLRKSADEYKQRFESDIDQTLSGIKKFINISVTIGTGLFIGYAAFRLFLDDKDRKESSKPVETDSVNQGFLNSVVSAGAEMAGIFLLTIAKNKLKEYITDLNIIETESDEYSGKSNREETEGD